MRMNRYAIAVALVTLTLGLTWAAIEFMPLGLHFPVVTFSVPGQLEMTFIAPGDADSKACARKAGEIATPLKTAAPGLPIVANCTAGLTADIRKFLSRAPIDAPSVRMADGTVVVYRAGASDLALAACKQSEAATSTQPEAKRVVCRLAGSPR